MLAGNLSYLSWPLDLLEGIVVLLPHLLHAKRRFGPYHSFEPGVPQLGWAFDQRGEVEQLLGILVEDVVCGEGGLEPDVLLSFLLAKTLMSQVPERG